MRYPPPFSGPSGRPQAPFCSFPPGCCRGQSAAGRFLESDSFAKSLPLRQIAILILSHSSRGFLLVSPFSCRMLTCRTPCAIIAAKRETNNLLAAGEAFRVDFVSLGLRRYRVSAYFLSEWGPGGQRSKEEELAMFREMRRKRQMLPQERDEDILRRGISGVLALEGEAGGH